MIEDALDGDTLMRVHHQQPRDQVLGLICQSGGQVWFSLYKVTSALANIAIQHWILFCAREVGKKEVPFTMGIGKEELIH